MTFNSTTEIQSNDLAQPVVAESYVLECKKLCKDYTIGPQPIRILDELDFTLKAGDWVSIVGTSGSGKTTLLNMLAGLDDTSSGTVNWSGQDISLLSEKQLGRLRNRHLGFVYQFHHLLAEFSALENVCMPLWIQGVNKESAQHKALEILKQVGLEDRAFHKPAELSGGERQRVAIARALITEPAMVLLDEPTGNLDSQTADEIQSLLRELNQRVNTAFVVVTHDLQFAKLASKSYRLDQGKLNLIE
ncbi:MAG: lipoprotein-releasing system ATP-binding protein [Psychrobacter glaciei]|jgi:lipoprotein-releasing system ATP-binding protein